MSKEFQPIPPDPESPEWDSIVGIDKYPHIFMDEAFKDKVRYGEVRLHGTTPDGTLKVSEHKVPKINYVLFEQ